MILFLVFLERCPSELPFGDPATGCWNCNPPCDVDGVCVSMDRCVCKEGYIGDGYDSCIVPIPKITSFGPKKSSTHGRVHVKFSVKHPEKFNVTQGYCRFGPIITKAAVTGSDGKFECVTPESLPGEQPVAVSYNLIKWSEERLFIKYISTDASSGSRAYKVFLYSLVLTVAAVVVMWILLRNDTDEMMPLNRWHLNQEISTMNKDKGFTEFVISLLSL